MQLQAILFVPICVSSFALGERAPRRLAASLEDIVQLVFMLIESIYLTDEVLLLDGGLSLLWVFGE